MIIIQLLISMEKKNLQIKIGKNELFLEIFYRNQEKKEYIIDEQNIKVSYLNDGYIECKFRILNEKYLNNF